MFAGVDPRLQEETESDLVGPLAAVLLYPERPLYELDGVEAKLPAPETLPPREVPPLMTVVPP